MASKSQAGRDTGFWHGGMQPLLVPFVWVLVYCLVFAGALGLTYCFILMVAGGGPMTTIFWLLPVSLMSMFIGIRLQVAAGLARPPQGA